MDDQTDFILGIVASAGIAICGLCIVVHAWRQSKMRGHMKPSRSNDDLSAMLEYAVPSASASTRRLSPPTDPTATPSEV